MCLIVAKPKGQQLPKGKLLKRWFKFCPDGFGVAFQYQGRVRILKGAMNTKEMFVLLGRMNQLLGKVNPRDIDIVIQYRRAVTGSVCPKYCHPFPISAKQEELDSLDVITDWALAHNGIIYDYTSTSWSKGYDINDAQEFIKDYLVGMGDALRNPSVQALVGIHTESKFALLSNQDIIYIGEFIVDNGYHFSNEGYKLAKPLVVTPHRLYEPTYSYLDEGYEEYGREFSGGIRCSGCASYPAILYTIPDDESWVCARCFEGFVGRPPQEIERAF